MNSVFDIPGYVIFRRDSTKRRVAGIYICVCDTLNAAELSTKVLDSNI